MKTYLLTFTALLLLAVPGLSQPSRTEPPVPSAPKSVEPQVVRKTQLSNGIAVWTVERHAVPVVNVSIVLDSGAAVDPPGKFGLSNFTVSLLDEGAAGKSSLAISDELDYLGARYSGSSDFDSTSLSVQVPSERLLPALKVLADITRRPDFPKEEIERIQTEMLVQLRQERDDASSLASYFFPKLLYPEGHRYAQKGSGGEAEIANFERTDLLAFHHQSFRPEQATILVVGDVTADRVTEQLEQTFGDWAIGKDAAEKVSALPLAPQVSKRRVVIVDKPGAAQTAIMIGRLGVNRNTSDYYALEVLNTVLGDSFTSRLNQNLREKNGYTYGARSAFTMRKETGPFYAAAAVQTDKTGPAVKEFFNELTRIAERIPEDELQKAKNYLAYRFPAQFETNSDIANGLAELLVYGLAEDTYARYVQRVQAVTAEDVEAAAKAYIDPDRMIVLLVGDRSVIEPEIKALDLGDLEYRDRMEGLSPQP